MVPVSTVRHRLVPAPQSYPGHGRRHVAHRPADRTSGRTDTTRTSSPPPGSTWTVTSWMTMPWTPNSCPNTLALRMPCPSRRSGLSARPKLRQSTACRHKTPGQAPTTTSQEPRKGGYRRYRNFMRDSWIPAVESLNIDVRPHDLRATCASLLIDAGASVKDVQNHLGHADPVTTMAIYARIRPGKSEDLASRMDALIAEVK